MCRKSKAVDAVKPSSQTLSRTRKASTSFTDPSSSSLSSYASPSTLFSDSLNFAAADRSSFQSVSSGQSPKLLPSPSNLRKNFLPGKPHIYDCSEISSATGNFLFGGLSSSSSAWRCRLRDRDVVVFQRRLRRAIDTTNLRRVLSTICSSHHSSVIKLLGASVSGNNIYLAYDFIRGVNLSDCLRNKINPEFTLLATWISRMQIAADIAHGLDYIHNFSGISQPSSKDHNPHSGFVHNHIKSSSIIVAEGSLDAKICHFGTAELCGEVGTFDEPKEEPNDSGSRQVLKRNSSNAMKFEGARGYMSPEFRAHGVGKQKSDVYAFGVVILEIISGDEPLKFHVDTRDGNDGGCCHGYRSVSVIETARDAIAGGTSGVRKWVDRRLKDSFPIDVARQMVRLGLDCVEDDPDMRPSMGRITNLISKLYLESKNWSEKFALKPDISVSIAPR